MVKKIKELYKSNKARYAILISLILLLINIYYLHSNRVDLMDKHRTEKLILQNNVEVCKDKYNQNRIETEIITTNTKTLIDVYENELNKLRKDFDVIDKNFKNLKNITVTTTNTSDKLAIKTSELNGYQTFYYNDDWTNISGKFNNGKLELKYSIDNKFTYVSFFKQKKLLNLIPVGRRRLYIQAMSSNPKTSINNLKTIDITPDKRKFRLSLQPQMGYGFTQHGFGFYTGVGLGIKFNNY